MYQSMIKCIFLCIVFLFICVNVFAAAEHEAIAITIVTDRQCSFCTTEPTESLLKQQLGQIDFTSIDYRTKKGAQLIETYALTTLPAFIVAGGSFSEREVPEVITMLFKKKEEAFVATKDVAGVFRFLERQVEKGRLDVFSCLTDASVIPMLKTLKRFCKENSTSFSVHFLRSSGVSQKEVMRETEEMQRMYAVRELYPQQFFSYLIRRLEDIDSSWWPEVMVELNVDFKKIKKFTESDAMDAMMLDEMHRISELGIKRGVALLVNNVSLFMMTDITHEVLTSITH